MKPTTMAKSGEGLFPVWNGGMIALMVASALLLAARVAGEDQRAGEGGEAATIGRMRRLAVPYELLADIHQTPLHSGCSLPCVVCISWGSPMHS